MKSSMIIHPDEVSKKWIHRLADAGVDVLGFHPVGMPSHLFLRPMQKRKRSAEK